jgi:hypothetical protein
MKRAKPRAAKPSVAIECLRGVERLGVSVAGGRRVVDAIDDVRRIEQERDAAVSCAEKAEANYRFMVERAADEKLDGYRALGERAAAAEAARDAMAAQLEGAIGEREECMRAVSVLHGRVADARARAEKAEAERTDLRERCERALRERCTCGVVATLADETEVKR